MRGTAAEPRILKALAGLGTEDGVRPKSIRTPELCRLTGITANNLGRAIDLGNRRPATTDFQEGHKV